MKIKYIFFKIVSILFILLSFTGCYLTSQIIPPSINITLPTFEVDPSFSYEDNITSPTPSHIQFENTIEGKIWFTRILDNEDYNIRSQIKLQFNTSEKIFKKEVFYWQRVGSSLSFRYAGKYVQKGIYNYSTQPNEFKYKLIENYHENSIGIQDNNLNNIDSIYSVWYNLDNSEMMTWDGKQYISQRALQNQSVKNYTNQKEITINY